MAYLTAALSARVEFVHKFEEVGEYPYFCMVHPQMAGMVVVQGAEVNSGSDIADVSSRISDVFVVNVFDPSATLKKFDTTLDCANNPVRITNVKATPVGTWSNDLAKLHQTVQDGKSDDIPDAAYQLAENGEVVLLKDDGSLEFRNANLRRHGQLPPPNT